MLFVSQCRDGRFRLCIVHGVRTVYSVQSLEKHVLKSKVTHVPRIHKVTKSIPPISPARACLCVDRYMPPWHSSWRAHYDPRVNDMKWGAMADLRFPWSEYFNILRQLVKQGALPSDMVTIMMMTWNKGVNLCGEEWMLLVWVVGVFSKRNLCIFDRDLRLIVF